MGRNFLSLETGKVNFAMQSDYCDMAFPGGTAGAH